MNNYVAFDDCKVCDGHGYITFEVQLFDTNQIEKEQCQKCLDKDERCDRAEYFMQQQRDEK